jgi:hypothetical protein
MACLMYLRTYTTSNKIQWGKVMETALNSSPSRVINVISVSSALMFIFALTGCAGSLVSESSDSISGSFGSSSKSSTSSSGERKEAYLGDVRHFTEVYTRSYSDIVGFTRGLSSISEKHGTTNWEADNTTYVGIGQGLAKAGLPEQQVDSFLSRLAQGDPVRISAIREGMGQRH